jgi:uncharacterized membrane protein YgcG
MAIVTARSGLSALVLSLASLSALATEPTTAPPMPPAAPAAPAAVAAPAAAPAPVAAPAAAAATDPAQQKVVVSEATAQAAAKLVCRNERVTGSNLRTRKVCSTPDSQNASGDWVRQQQERGGINASAVMNNGN